MTSFRVLVFQLNPTRPGEMTEKKASAPIIVMATREVQINKFYGDSDARDTRRFEDEVKAAWRVQHCDTDQERRSLFWSHLGEEVRQ